MILYCIILITDLFLKQKKICVTIQFFLLVFVYSVLSLTLDFPNSKRIFGDTSPLLSVFIMLVCTIFGMISNHIFYMDNKKPFSWYTFLRPIVISPIVLLPILGSALGGSQKLNTIQLISFAFLSFQNGFFWKEIFERVRSKM